jgi:hypothetical protein
LNDDDFDDDDFDDDFDEDFEEESDDEWDMGDDQANDADCLAERERATRDAVARSKRRLARRQNARPRMKDGTLTGETRKRPRDGPEPRHRVRIARTRVGKGVFAREWYRSAQIVGEIEGVVIHEEDYASEYCIDMGDGRCLEPEPPFRYLNHSCQPNCRFCCHDVREPSEPCLRRRVFLYALRTIRPGEELTIDYAWPARAAIRCRCGTPSCRGWIVAEDELAAVEDADGAEHR